MAPGLKTAAQRPAGPKAAEVGAGEAAAEGLLGHTGAGEGALGMGAGHSPLRMTREIDTIYIYI